MADQEDYLLTLLADAKKKSKSPSTLRLLEALTGRVVELTKAYNEHEHHGHARMSESDEYTSRGDVVVGPPIAKQPFNCHQPRLISTGPPKTEETET